MSMNPVGSNPHQVAANNTASQPTSSPLSPSSNASTIRSAAESGQNAPATDCITQIFQSISDFFQWIFNKITSFFIGAEPSTVPGEPVLQNPEKDELLARTKMVQEMMNRQQEMAPHVSNIESQLAKLSTHTQSPEENQRRKDLFENFKVFKDGFNELTHHIEAYRRVLETQGPNADSTAAAGMALVKKGNDINTRTSSALQNAIQLLANRPSANK